mmetsp:Transcript_11300/g.20887  ORF Transcript_11300/g.20887 Transcript_11300/m.20887 type:complete len:393 (+) Transcript_11300:476-1654(+)
MTKVRPRRPSVLKSSSGASSRSAVTPSASCPGGSGRRSVLNKTVPKGIETRKSSHSKPKVAKKALASLSTLYNFVEEEHIVPISMRPMVSAKFLEAYELGPLIGKGRTSLVRKVVELKSGKVHACKIVGKNGRQKSERIVDEIKVLQAVEHPNIVKLRHLIETQTEVAMLLDLGHGGDLYERLTQHKYSEDEAKVVMRDLLGAVQHLHERNIIHRDIKPENILLVDRDVCTRVMLIDFGSAKVWEGSEDDPADDLSISDAGTEATSPGKQDTPRTRRARAYTSCGTDNYAAPEVLLGEGYGTAVDLWSLGAVMYVLIGGGAAPFAKPGQEAESVFGRALSGKVDFPAATWAGVSAEAKAMIQALLTVDPERRPTCAEALQMPWLASCPAVEH